MKYTLTFVSTVQLSPSNSRALKEFYCDTALQALMSLQTALQAHLHAPSFSCVCVCPMSTGSADLVAVRNNCLASDIQVPPLQLLADPLAHLQILRQLFPPSLVELDVATRNVLHAVSELLEATWRQKTVLEQHRYALKQRGAWLHSPASECVFLVGLVRC